MAHNWYVMFEVKISQGVKDGNSSRHNVHKQYYFIYICTFFALSLHIDLMNSLDK